MKKSDTFEALKGNVKTVNLARLIEQERKDFIDWVSEYYTEEQLILIKQSKSMTKHSIYSIIEPDWPKGKKRTLSSHYDQKVNFIRSLENLQEKILTIAFPSWQDELADFEVDSIVVRRKEK